jgi:hypothetical protein
MKYYWFGDSWVCGDELEKQVPYSEVVSHTFSQLVSDRYGAKNINLGENGSSIDVIPLKFWEVYSDINPEVDRVFFCLTANHRVSMFDESGQLLNILPGGYTNHHRLHPYVDQWYKYFDSKYQRTYNFDKTLGLLYLWCQRLNIKCYFLNIFTTINDMLMTNIIPEDAWLIPSHRCLAESIFMYINNYDLMSDGSHFTVEQWQQQQIAMEMYIKPNWQHPNILGHKKIAQYLITLLDNSND